MGEDFRRYLKGEAATEEIKLSWQRESLKIRGNLYHKIKLLSQVLPKAKRSPLPTTDIAQFHRIYKNNQNPSKISSPLEILSLKGDNIPPCKVV